MLLNMDGFLKGYKNLLKVVTRIPVYKVFVYVCMIALATLFFWLPYWKQMSFAWEFAILNIMTIFGVYCLKVATTKYGVEEWCVMLVTTFALLVFFIAFIRLLVYCSS